METQTVALNKLEIKKELYRTKVEANFSHYGAGALYYTVKVGEVLYQFPIWVNQKREEITVNDSAVKLGENTWSLSGLNFTHDGNTGENFKMIVDRHALEVKGDLIELSRDLGDTYFKATIRASELNRWIDKAIDKNQFVKLS